MGCLNIMNRAGFQKIEFLCPECGELPPEILSINADNKVVGFNCKICAENEYKSQFFSKKEYRSDNIINYYCKQRRNNNEDKAWFKEYLNQTESLTDNQTFFQNPFSDGKLNEYKEKIRQKNEQLEKIIKFNEILIEESETNQNNYWYLKSLDNICKSLEIEKERKLKDLKFLSAVLNNDFEISENGIVTFLNEKDVNIDRENEYLFLNDKKLNDENIKCIALILFNNLKEIDLSGNEITNIEALCDINLPFLEFLNLSYNKIQDIEPLRERNNKNLKYLFIHNNQIEDITILCDPDFPTLNILTLENNKINEQSKQFQNLFKLYKKNQKILVTNINEILEKYQNNKNFRYNEKKEIELENTNEGDSMLNNLLIIIIVNKNYIIKSLKLKGNQIKKPSILNIIQFNDLETLDLSLNHIKSLDFLKGMKAKELKNLLLDDNYINNLSFLYNTEKLKELFPRLERVSLKKNNFDPNESQYEVILTNILKEKDINLKINENEN